LDRIRKTIVGRIERKESAFWSGLFKFGCAYRNFWVEKGYDTPLMNRMICSRLQEQLGGRLEYVLIGGAPLSPDTQRIVRAFLNVKLMVVSVLFGVWDSEFLRL